MNEEDLYSTILEIQFCFHRRIEKALCLCDVFKVQQYRLTPEWVL